MRRNNCKNNSSNNKSYYRRLDTLRSSYDLIVILYLPTELYARIRRNTHRYKYIILPII